MDSYLCQTNHSVQFSCSVVSDSLQPHELQYARLPWSITNSWSSLKLMSIELVMPSNHLILCCPFLLPPSIFPSIRVFSNESVLCIRWPKHWSFSASPSVLPKNTQDWFPLGRTGGSPCCPGDSPESSTTPRFKSISSLALSFLYNPALKSIHDHRKNQSFETDLCWQSNVSVF